MRKNTVGIYSDSSLGSDLALNLTGHNISVSVLNRKIEQGLQDEQADFIKKMSSDNLSVLLDIDSFLISLETQKKIILISNDYNFSQYAISMLEKRLSKGDIIIDMCDSFYKTASEVQIKLSKAGIYYLSVGFSGGREAARHGVSLLPGGDLQAYNQVSDIFKTISVRLDNSFYCSPYIGPGGSGQYVKMIHNAIEYAVLEIYAESISVLRAIAGCDSVEIAEILNEWNTTENESYLLSIFCDIYTRSDSDSGKPIADIVLDKVGYTENMVWLSKNALEYSVPIPTVRSALDMRFFSEIKNERIASSRMIKQPAITTLSHIEKIGFVENLKAAVNFCCLCVYAQCFSLLKKTSDINGWNINCLDVAKTLQGSSYVKARGLNRVIEAFEHNKSASNILTDTYFKNCAENFTPQIRSIITKSVEAGIPIPAIMSVIEYIDSYRTSNLQIGNIQLARDYINGAGYERTDKPGYFTAYWEDPGKLLKERKIR